MPDFYIRDDETNEVIRRDVAGMREFARNFALSRDVTEFEPLTNGNINSTFKLYVDGRKPIILQKINGTVFPKPSEVMENIEKVTEHIRKRAKSVGRNPKRATLNIVGTNNGEAYYIDENGDYWRMYESVDNARTYENFDGMEKKEAEKLFSKAGIGFGRFQRDLLDFDISKLHTTIPNFHNTPSRFKDFMQAIREDKMGRYKEVQGNRDHPLIQAIEYILSREEEMSIIQKELEEGMLPQRVAHNDTKINNVMVDETTQEAVCVIDLDTVMPDTMLADFGDAIRSGANKLGEETASFDEVEMDMRLYEAFTEGFLSQVGKNMTPEEKALLHKAPKIYTLELAMRFLGDYLNGDIYFGNKTNNPKFNLQRGMVQLKLAQDMETKEQEMEAINREILDRGSLGRE